MKCSLLVFVLTLILTPQIVEASEPGDISVKAKVWFADPGKVKFLSMDQQVSEEPMPGFQVSYDLNETDWVSALYMQGSFDSVIEDRRFTGDGSIGLLASAELEETSAEILVGRSFRYADLGVGIRYSQFLREFSAEGSDLRDQYGINSASGSTDSDALGPVIYVGFGGSFGESAFGWFMGTSVLVLDMQDSQGEHFANETGLSCAIGNVVLTVAARHKVYFEELEVPIQLQSGSGAIEETSDWTMVFAGACISAAVNF